MKKIKIGLLPHYLELYDKTCGERRPEMESFVSLISGEFNKRGVEVVTGRVCRLVAEFAKEIRSFESAGAQAIVSLHLAYSPSLESATELKSTKLPLIIFDTTPDYEFSPDTDPRRIMFNHGIHGVQDLCNMLLRNGKDFMIEAGHWRKSDVFERIIQSLEAVCIADSLRNARTGLIGTPFKGMGDFSVPFERMKKEIGITAVPFDFTRISEYLPKENSSEVKNEIRSDMKMFKSGKLEEKDRVNTVRAGIAIRRWIKENNLSAFSANFMECAKGTGLPTVPFLEASKSMANGIGYAGEGDVLTASFVGALMSQYPETTFTEMFCPDWKSNRIFLSHMGEVNMNLLHGKPELVRCGFPIEDTNAPLLAAGRLKSGKATLVNIAPGKDNSYTLITAIVSVEQVRDIKFKNSVRGWIKPQIKIGDFLAEYSRAGGTHHLAMVYGDKTEPLAKFAKLMAWKAAKIG
jgi:L-arabinose isomerase